MPYARHTISLCVIMNIINDLTCLHHHSSSALITNQFNFILAACLSCYPHGRSRAVHAITTAVTRKNCRLKVACCSYIVATALPKPCGLGRRPSRMLCRARCVSRWVLQACCALGKRALVDTSNLSQKRVSRGDHS